MRNLFIKDKFSLSSERMLRKDCDRNVSVVKRKLTPVMSLKGFGAKRN
jgi:hypothetical protein